jgi:hypothetical protein
VAQPGTVFKLHMTKGTSHLHSTNFSNFLNNQYCIGSREDVSLFNMKSSSTRQAILKSPVASLLPVQSSCARRHRFADDQWLRAASHFLSQVRAAFTAQHLSRAVDFVALLNARVMCKTTDKFTVVGVHRPEHSANPQLASFVVANGLVDSGVVHVLDGYSALAHAEVRRLVYELESSVVGAVVSAGDVDGAVTECG